ncbi:MAG: hypothetical protein AAB932_04765 [Patescibacteria group bacterium]
MTNINFEVAGYSGTVLESMLRKGYAKTKTEAIRLALFEFDQKHALTEEQLYEKAVGKMLTGIKSGHEKVRKFSLRELD